MRVNEIGEEGLAWEPWRWRMGVVGYLSSSLSLVWCLVGLIFLLLPLLGQSAQQATSILISRTLIPRTYLCSPDGLMEEPSSNKDEILKFFPRVDLAHPLPSSAIRPGVAVPGSASWLRLCRYPSLVVGCLGFAGSARTTGSAVVVLSILGLRIGVLLAAA